MILTDRKLLLKRTIVLLSLCLFFALPAALHAKTYPNIVAFGDSLSDHGGLASYLGVYDPDTNPGGALEVWSNGDVWVEYLAAKWSAELDNNAIAGAMTSGHENETVEELISQGTLPALGLVGQINTYKDEEPEFDSENTLFTIWIGGNDLLEFMRGEAFTTDPSELLTASITNIQVAVNKLYEIGARKFLILNLPDIGSTPSFLMLSEESQQTATLLTQQFNAALLDAVNSLATSLSDTEFNYFDMFSFMNTMIEDNAFPNVTGTYMELDESGNKTFENVNGPAEDYLFWDGIHPTTKAHEMVADEVNEDLFADTEESGDDSSSSCFIGSLFQD